MRLAVATTEAAEFTWRAALSQAEEEGSQLVQVEGLLLCRRCLLAGAKLHGLEQHVLAALRGQPGVECSPETSARLAGCVTTGVALPLELSEALSEPAAVQAVWLSLTLSLSRAWRAVGYLRNAYAEERQASALLATYGLHDAATALCSHSAHRIAAEKGWADALCDARGVQLLSHTSTQAAAALLAHPRSQLVALRALACAKPRHGDEQAVEGSAVLWVLPLRCWEAAPEATLHVHVVNTATAPILATQLRAHLAPAAGGRTLMCEHAGGGVSPVELPCGESRLQFTVSQAALSEAQPGPHVLAFLSVALGGGLSLVARPRRWLQPPHRRGRISPPLVGASSSVVAPAAGGPQPPGAVVLDVPSQEAAAVDVSLVLPHTVLLTHGPEAHAWQWLGVRVHVADAPLQGATLALSGGAGLHVPLDQPCWAWRQGADTLLHAPLEEGTLSLPEMRSGHALVVWLRVQVVGGGRARLRLGTVVRRPGAESVVHMFAKTLAAHAVAPFTVAVSHALEPSGGGGPRAVLHVRLVSQLPQAVVITAATLQHASATPELQSSAQVVVEPGQPCGFVWTMSPVDRGRSQSTTVAQLQVLYAHDAAAQPAPCDAFGADLLPSIGGQSGAGGIPWSCPVELPLLPSWLVTCTAPPVGCVGQRLRFSFAVKRVAGPSLDAAPAQAVEEDGPEGCVLHWRAQLCSRHWIPLGPEDGQLSPPSGGDSTLVWLECVPLSAGEWSAPQLQLLPRDAASKHHVWHVPAAPQLVRVLPGYGAPGAA